MPKGTFTVKITKTGKDPIHFIREVNARIYPELQAEIYASAEIVAQIMQQILLSSGYKLDKLANAIKADFPITTGGLIGGIGKIADLPVGSESGASYWEAFNSGFAVTTANIGYFGNNLSAPEAGGSGEKWHHTGKGSGFFFMQPNKIIPPLSYIDIGDEALRAHILKSILKFNKSLENASK